MIYDSPGLSHLKVLIELYTYKNKWQLGLNFFIFLDAGTYYGKLFFSAVSVYSEPLQPTQKEKDEKKTNSNLCKNFMGKN